ncbi:alpha/beta fold hydrolase [Winogradskyella sp. 3972H.M.0a.05]|uniref:YheT family hydrolase n=1 Tax=Winogradskyella sp. 3972H.M.0a.05 TaxID=2950277 RepID=UPI00339B81F9
MPLIESTYQPKFLFKKGHFSTVYSGLFRSVKGVVQKRERLELDDGDFIDLDWSYSVQKAEKVIIILHGLEGNAQRPYITGTAKLFNSDGYDTCSVNFRGCSGEENRLWRSYHSGETNDLDAVVKLCIDKGYSEVYIKGFSLGGNVTLKYLGEERQLPSEIKGAVAISVPCSLYSSCVELHKMKNVLYADRFKRHLIGRLRLKQKLFPENISIKEINAIKTLKEFDDAYTSKAHGFIDAMDYYEKSSSLQFLPNIKIPTLVINALNDSFLGPECFPIKEAKENDNFFLEMPKYGGHVGFFEGDNVYYNEKRSLHFLNDLHS